MMRSHLFRLFPTLILALCEDVAQSLGTDSYQAHPALDKRGLFQSQPGANGKGGSSQTPSGPPRDPSAPVNESCKIERLVPQTWSALKLDDYLKKYPGGSNLTLTEYAASKGAPNFDCGIGNMCHAGQPCHPVPLPDWYILFSVQQWNIKMNLMKKAIAYGMSFVKSTMASLLAALVPAIDLSHLDHFKLDFSVNGALTMVSNTVVLDIFCFFGSFQDTTGNVFNIINNIMGAGFSLVSGLLPNPQAPEEPMEGFDAWAHLEKQMATYQSLLTQKLANETEKIELAGISTDEGIYGQVKNGTYFTSIDAIFLPRVEDDLKNVTLAISLVKVLRSLDAFVTIGQDACHYDGENGAVLGDNVLSYCDRNGTMFNIIRVKNGKESNQFQNAEVIEERFGYSTQFLTNASWSCQKKYSGFEPFPYKNLTLPRDVLSDCIINLPVCDCRDPMIKNEIRHGGVVKACRKAGLPI